MKKVQNKKIQFEVCMFDGCIDIDDLIKLFFVCDKNKVDTVVLPPTLLEYKKNFYSSVETSCLIDFPLGLNTLRMRIAACIDAINIGVSKLDICCNSFNTHNLHRKRIKKEIRAIHALTTERAVETRFILDYKNYSIREYISLCSFLYDCGVENIVNHNGMSVDDPVDNLIIAEKASRDLPLNMFASSLMFEQTHYELIEKTKIRGFRVCSNKISRFFDENGV